MALQKDVVNRVAIDGESDGLAHAGVAQVGMAEAKREQVNRIAGEDTTAGLVETGESGRGK